MLLSIGMIVKNEENGLGKCLEALQPLLNGIDAEVVIIDTGSNDRTVEIAKAYTKNVFFFNWINDFAAARNISLDKSKGEWFMFIDADEVAEDLSGLIQFFQSTEHKKYNGATICVRNYLDKDQKAFSDFNVPRIIRRSKDIRFEGSVHEHFTKDPLPIKVLQAVFGHSGYYYETEEVRNEKCRRNRELLLKEIEKNPKASLPYLQMMEVYEVEENYEAALEYYNLGIAAARKEQKEDLVLCFYANGTMCYQKMERPLEALKIAELYFTEKKRERTLDLEMYAWKGLAHLSAGDPLNAIAAFGKYANRYKEYEKNRTLTNEMAYHSLQFVSEASYYEIVLHGAEACRRMVDFEGTRKWLEEFPNTYTVGMAGYLARFKIELEVMGYFKDYHRIIQLYETAEGDFAKWVEKGIEIYVYGNASHWMNVLEVVHDTNHIKTPLFELLDLFYEDHVEDKIAKESLCKSLEENKTLSGLYIGLFYLSVKAGLPLSSFIKKMDGYELRTSIKTLQKQWADTSQRCFHYISEFETEDEREQLWIGYLASALILEKGHLEEEESLYLLSVFAECVYAYLKVTFRPEKLTDEWAETLPRIQQLGYNIYMAILSIEKGNQDKAQRYLETSEVLEPGMSKVVWVLKDRALESEMDQYARKIKESIKQFVLLGKVEEAKHTIAAYEQIRPGDPEIEQIKKAWSKNTK